ncbi:LytR/AlgR family response regulator transcription factor [Clostridium chrysemydis]|uniref:LytR/AlgR family response regulator transcription factor n=1 Tax=Clostridium chrysemydis TaxID=2665504 RepID=UPI0018836C89|nr:LytTR family DNA-binding domain-containing protein [Clostridium chrysemydis]
MDIIICEDDHIQRIKLEKIIDRIIVSKDLDMRVKLSTDDPECVLKELNKKNNCLYLLDVDLNSRINGIELAEKIRKYDKECSIIFITTHSEMAPLTFEYKLEALDYIIKDNYGDIANKIESCLKYANEKILTKDESSGIFKVDSRTSGLNIKLNEILYFETSNSIHKVIIHLDNRNIEFYGKMKEIDEKLRNSNFCRCHTSFIVNKDKIKEINKKKRVLSIINGDECLISYRGLKKLLNK